MMARRSRDAWPVRPTNEETQHAPHSRIAAAGIARPGRRPPSPAKPRSRSAQSTIDAQLKAFQADDGGLAYSYAAPNVKRIFPTVDIFMGMVESGYQPVRKPRNYAFGKVEEMSAHVDRPAGADRRARTARTTRRVYTLELQPDGVYRITGVSLRASNALST